MLPSPICRYLIFCLRAEICSLLLLKSKRMSSLQSQGIFNVLNEEYNIYEGHYSSFKTFSVEEIQRIVYLGFACVAMSC